MLSAPWPGFGPGRGAAHSHLRPHPQPSQQPFLGAAAPRGTSSSPMQRRVRGTTAWFVAAPLLLLSLLLLLASSGTGVRADADDDALPPCFTTTELAALGITPLERGARVRPIVSERSPWAGHYLTTALARILLNEAMGYRLDPQQSPNGGDYGTFERIATNAFDLNPECWPASAGIADYNYWVTQQRLAIDSGSLGLVGRSAWYVPSYLLNQPAASAAFVDIGRAYGTATTNALFPRAGTVPDHLKAGTGREFVPEWCALERNPPGCLLNGDDWFARRCNVTVYNPHCMELFGVDGLYDPGLLQQQVRNNRWNMTVPFLGETNFYAYVQSYMDAQVPVVLYYWSPSLYVAQNSFRRVALLDPDDHCYRNSTTDFQGSGSVDCDFQIQTMLKVYSPRMLDDADYADFRTFMDRFHVRNGEQNAMFAGMSADPATWVVEAHNRTCRWLKQNTPVWTPWISNTPADPNALASLWTALGYVSFVWTGASLVATTVMLLTRYRIFPLKFTHRVLAVPALVGVAMQLQVSVLFSVVNPEHYPPDTWYWLYVLSPALVYSAALAGWIRFYLMSQWRVALRAASAQSAAATAARDQHTYVASIRAGRGSRSGLAGGGGGGGGSRVSDGSGATSSPAHGTSEQLRAALTHAALTSPQNYADVKQQQQQQHAAAGSPASATAMSPAGSHAHALPSSSTSTAAVAVPGTASPGLSATPVDVAGGGGGGGGAAASPPLAGSSAVVASMRRGDSGATLVTGLSSTGLPAQSHGDVHVHVHVPVSNPANGGKATAAAAARATATATASDAAASLHASAAAVARLSAYRAYTSNTYALALWLALFAPALLVAGLCFDDAIGAGMSRPAVIASGVIAIGYDLSFLVLVRWLRTFREGVGMRRQVLLVAAFCTLFDAIRGIVQSGGDPAEFVSNRGFYLPLCLSYLSVNVYLLCALVLPGLATFNNCTWCEATTTSDGTYDLDDPACQITLAELLKQKLGFRYFLLFCTMEFAEESPVCWKSIEHYRKAPTELSARALYERFISEDAPMQVNVSHANAAACKRILYRVGGGGGGAGGDAADAPVSAAVLATVFDAIQTELVNLMTADTYGRFKGSHLFVRYLDGVPLLDRELYGKAGHASQSETSRNGGGGGGGGGGGAMGGRVSRPAPIAIGVSQVSGGGRRGGVAVEASTTAAPGSGNNLSAGTAGSGGRTRGLSAGTGGTPVAPKPQRPAGSFVAVSTAHATPPPGVGASAAGGGGAGYGYRDSPALDDPGTPLTPGVGGDDVAAREQKPLLRTSTYNNNNSVAGSSGGGGSGGMTSGGSSSPLHKESRFRQSKAAPTMGAIELQPAAAGPSGAYGANKPVVRGAFSSHATASYTHTAGGNGNHNNNNGTASALHTRLHAAVGGGGGGESPVLPGASPDVSSQAPVTVATRHSIDAGRGGSVLSAGGSGGAGGGGGGGGGSNSTSPTHSVPSQYSQYGHGAGLGLGGGGGVGQAARRPSMMGVVGGGTPVLVALGTSSSPVNAHHHPPPPPHPTT